MELLDGAYQDEEDKTPHYRLKLRNNLQLDKPSKKQRIIQKHHNHKEKWNNTTLQICRNTHT